jgi:two-component system cell cycle sensor histidine kinase/response regulator CckA
MPMTIQSRERRFDERQAAMRVLLVEDSDADASALQSLLHESGFASNRVSSLRKAITALQDEPADVVLLDLGLPDSTGQATLQRLREATREVPIVVLTGTADEDAAVAAVAAGAQDYLTKGSTDGRALVRAIRYARERHLADECLRASEERFRVLIENSCDGIALLDEAGTIRYSSPGVTAILGWEVHEFQSRSVFDFVHEEDRDEARRSFEALIRGEMRYQFTHRRYVCKDGSTRIIEVTRSNRLDDSCVGAIVANYRDVTDRRRAADALHSLRRQYESILDSIADGVHGIGLDGRVVFENPAAARMLGWKKDEMIGRAAHETMHHSRPDGGALSPADCPILATLSDGIVRHVAEDAFWRSDGTLLRVDYNVAPMLDAAQQIIGAVVTFRDITRQKQLEEQVEQARRVTSLGRVAASVAHEFNNVLMSMQPFAEIIRRQTQTNEKVTTSLEKIFGALKRGKRLTEQILRFTNPAEPVIDRIDLEQWLRDFLDEAKNLLQSRPLTLDAPKPLIARADVMQLQQIMTNLLANARDASASSSPVTIGLMHASDVPFLVQRLQDPRSFVTLYVRDAGSGIAPEIQEQIFEPLFTTKPRGGTGLGLAVAQQIVTRHGGKILVDSVEGSGSTFHVVLPDASRDN